MFNRIHLGSHLVLFFLIQEEFDYQFNVCMVSCFSCVWLFVTLWTITHQTSLSMGFSRQEYCHVSPALAGGFFTTSATSIQYLLLFGLYVSRSLVSNTLQPRELQPTNLLCPWISPSKNTEVGNFLFLHDSILVSLGVQKFIHFFSKLSNLLLYNCSQYSHNPLYFCGISCSIPPFIYNFIYSGPLFFFLRKSN